MDLDKGVSSKDDPTKNTEHFIQMYMREQAKMSQVATPTIRQYLESKRAEEEENVTVRTKNINLQLNENESKKFQTNHKDFKFYSRRSSMIKGAHKLSTSEARGEAVQVNRQQKN